MKQMILLSALLCLTACSIHAPEVRVTGERSALEQQILGQYESLSSTLWAVGSTRDLPPDLPDSLKEQGNRERVAEAIRVRRFYLDDRLRFLASGHIGEGRDGMLIKRKDATLIPLGPQDMGNFNNFWYPEQAARRTILDRLRRLNPGHEQEALLVFAGIQRDEAPPGAWIENSQGRWVRK